MYGSFCVHTGPLECVVLSYQIPWFDVYYNIADASHIPITVDVVVMSIVLVVVLGSAAEVDVVVARTKKKNEYNTSNTLHMSGKNFF